jgi:hypothetical protein
MNYIFKLSDLQNYEIDSITLFNCKNRIEAVERAKNILLSQGLKIAKFKVSIKQTN